MRSFRGGTVIRWIQWSMGCSCLVLLFPFAVMAQEAPTDALPVAAEVESAAPPANEIRVYQQRPTLRTLRVEVAPTVGVSLNDPLTLHWSVGGVLNVHLSEEIAIGGSYHRFFHHELPVSDEIAEEFGVFAERRPRDFQAGGHVIWSPIYGKFTLFQGPILHFAGHFTGGGGVMRTCSPGSGGDLRPTWNIGAGVSLMLAQWFSLGLSIADHMYIEEFAKAGSSFQNDVHVQMALGLHFPPSVEYRYPK
jgi:outer membrane beta-barrel protein